MIGGGIFSFSIIQSGVGGEGENPKKSFAKQVLGTHYTRKLLPQNYSGLASDRRTGDGSAGGGRGNAFALTVSACKSENLKSPCSSRGGGSPNSLWNGKGVEEKKRENKTKGGGKRKRFWGVKNSSQKVTGKSLNEGKKKKEKFTKEEEKERLGKEKCKPKPNHSLKCHEEGRRHTLNECIAIYLGGGKKKGFKRESYWSGGCPPKQKSQKKIPGRQDQRKEKIR